MRTRSSPLPGEGASTFYAWTADYLKITGELDVDLRSNIAAEARAKIVYERLINFSDDLGRIEALQFLMTREIAHMKAFTVPWRALASTLSESLDEMVRDDADPTQFPVSAKSLRAPSARSY